jgi:hypothetical protein
MRDQEKPRSILKSAQTGWCGQSFYHTTPSAPLEVASLHLLDVAAPAAHLPSG